MIYRSINARLKAEQVRVSNEKKILIMGKDTKCFYRDILVRLLVFGRTG